MKIIKHVILVICLLATQTMATADRDFALSLWKNYQMNQRNLIISHSTRPFSISFTQRVQQQWKSEYLLGQEKTLIIFTNRQEVLQVISQGENIAIRGLKEGEQIQLSTSMLQASSFQIDLIKNSQVIDTLIQKTKISVQNFNSLRFRAKDSSFANNFQEQKILVRQQGQNKLQQLLMIYKINQAHSQFGKKMLSKTFSHLCRQNHRDLSFIGICYNVHEGKHHKAEYKIDIRYSPLIIDRLFPVYPKTALFLFQELVGLLEDQVFYSDAEFVQIPQHISIIKGFISTLKNNSYDGSKLKERVKHVLNGLMNQMLLSQVNSLQQQINYRQNKKMHPTLLKMISLKWQSNSRKNALSSIYQQSFTPDYFYNYANQKPDNCVSKFAWLTAATAEFVFLIKSFGNQDDRDALDQSVSLFKILQQVSGSDAHAKQGRYYSISQAQGVRVYVEQVGYQSFLPYIYELSSIFPEQFLKNVTTPTGLASLNVNHAKFSNKFEFRGNIHTYFNYKILFQARRKLQSSRYQRALGLVEDLITKVRTKILQFNTQDKHFTSWSTSGEGIRERGGLSMISLLLMGEKR